MSRTFTKLFASITESTIWVAPDPHLRLWVYFLANADQDGNVWGSIPGIANHSRVPIEAVQAALKSFMSPDPYSRTKTLEGRRIEEIDGGWHLVNHGKYRAMMHAEERREKNRQYKHAERARKVNVSSGQQMSAPSAQAEAEAEALKSNPLSGKKPPDDVRADRSDPKAKARQQANAIAKRVITYLNERVGTEYQGTKAHCNLIILRVLQDRATEAELREVIDAKVAEWGADADRRRFLSPDTLFNATKYAKYVGQLSMGAAPPADAAGRPCDYCASPSVGSVNGYHHCRQHGDLALDLVSPARAKVRGPAGPTEQPDALPDPWGSS